MAQLTLEDLRKLLAKHDSLDFDAGILDDPPDIQLPRRCLECGRSLPPFRIGWDQIEWAVNHDEALPERLDQRQCDTCTPTDDED
jgi:hypothetical protein